MDAFAGREGMTLGFVRLSRGRFKTAWTHLWKPFLEIVRRSDASIFVMENVPQILGSPELKQIVKESEEMNFKIAPGKLCSVDYGVLE